MRYNIKGYHETRDYKVIAEKFSKPFLIPYPTYVWETILMFENEFLPVSLFESKDEHFYLAIGENERHLVRSYGFRADLNEFVV